MSLIELKNIGKIYVQNGAVAVGIRGVNLSFDLGEFVTITGKSGAGKSTLLNVISGMDSYEEGELLIEGKETSHYLQKEWEEYRKKYISFIFQDYNIIDSYTVLQNVELSLMHIDNPVERRGQAIEYIKKVGLEKKMKSRGSKLSGGEKQRTVIARALAKNSPVIIADEPTGNLDSKSSSEIIKLLSEVAKNRLVIVVTHNFDDFSEYATRHVRIYDGAVESDEVIRKGDEVVDAVKPIEERNTRFENFKRGVRLGRTIFFSKPKLAAFMMVLMLLATIILFVTGANYSNGFDLFKKSYMFNNIDGRMIITRIDGNPITDSELENLKVKYDLDSYLHYDYLLDNPNQVTMMCDDSYNEFSVAYVYNKTYGKNIIGHYPEKENEVFLYLPISYQSEFGSKELLKTRIGFPKINNNSLFTISGVKYYYDNNKTPEALFTKEGFNLATAIYYMSSGSSANGRLIAKYNGEVISRVYNLLIPSFDLEVGKAYVNDYMFYDFVHKFNGDDFTATLEVTCTYQKGNSIYRFDYYDPVGPGSITFNKTYDTSSIVPSTDSDVKNFNDGIYVSVYELNEIASQVLETSYTQASLFFKDNIARKKAVDSLKDDGYIAVESNTDFSQQSLYEIITTLGNIFALIGFFIVIIFVAFFINLVTGKMLDAYRSELGIMRSMGINVKVIKIGMYFRIIFSIIPAYLLVILALLVFYLVPSLNPIIRYLYWYQYLFITLGLFYLTARVGRKQDKKLFSQSVKASIKGGGMHD